MYRNPLIHIAQKTPSLILTTSKNKALQPGSHISPTLVTAESWLLIISELLCEFSP